MGLLTFFYLEELTNYLTHGGSPDLPNEKGNHHHHTSRPLSLMLSATHYLTNYSTDFPVSPIKIFVPQGQDFGLR